ncbi:MAG: universal stress protein [Candidatus Obscuribacterales bacterium]|jgi:nucleotide-binding universal stress UspA family protein
MRVLVAIEDKRFGKAIVDFLVAHEWQAGTMFRLVHVVEPSVVGDQVTAVYGIGVENEIVQERLNDGSLILNQMREQLQAKFGSTFPVEVNVVKGHPHHVILDIAEEWHSDMIVLGSHGRQGFTRFVLGSVSLAVVSHAQCTVTVVRLPRAVNVDGSQQATEQTVKETSTSRG